MMLRSPLTPILRSPLSFPLNRIVSGFFPSRLFASGEQGAWYDPSDRATLFQDSAGTTPVTAVEQPVGLILDKSKGLVLGPELVTNGGPFVNTTGYSIVGTTTLSTVEGDLKVDSSGAGGAVWTFSSLVIGRTYKITFSARTSAGVAVSARVASNDLLTIIATSKDIVATSNTQETLVFTATQTNNKLYFRNANTAVSFIDSVSVRELPGNHAFQDTTTSRPVLSARYNLLTKTEQFDDAAWAKSNATVTPNATTAPDGTLTADLLIPATISGQPSVRQNLPTGNPGAYTGSVYIKAAGYTKAVVYMDNMLGASLTYSIDLTTGVLTPTRTPSPVWTNFSAQSVALPNGWYLVRPSGATSATGIGFRVFVDPGNVSYDGFGIPSAFSGDGTSGIYIWGASLTPANQASLPYQRVNTSTDYDADPAKFPVYLRFDGVDDWLQTNSIDFTATDKMTVFAGVRKLSDAARGIAVELSASTAASAGSFVLSAPEGATSNYGFGSRGSALNSPVAASPFAAPITNILTGLGDISGDSAILRVDGTQVASSTADQGTGNYGNYPLYIGRRGGTTLPFNGQLYSLIVRGAQTSTTQIAQTETWVNGKTKAY